MPYVSFHDYFPDIAEQETRSFTVLEDPELPPGSYALAEMYCNEPGCDCRRVFFSVLSSLTKRIEAVIAYGWESPRFYTQWMGDNDPEIIKELKGPTSNLLSPQSDLAPAILKVVRDVVLQDRAYVERLKDHYKMLKHYIDNKRQTTTAESKRKGISSRSSGRRKRRG